MIKKLRAYLLEDDDNRNSLSWYVVIIIIAPFIGVFFQYKKEKSVEVAKINGFVLDKNIVKLKLYEQSLLLERFVSVFGKENLDFLIQSLFGGKSPEEFVVQSELLKVYLSYLFEKFVGSMGMVDRFMIDSFKNQSGYLMKSLLGDFIFQLVSGRSDDLSHFKKSLDMNKVDLYCQSIVAGDFTKKIFALPINSIYSVCNNRVVSGGTPQKIIFDVYECVLKKRDDLDEIKKTVPDSSLKQFYNNKVLEGHYRNDFLVDGIFSVYTLNREKSKNNDELLSDDEFYSLVEKRYYSLLADDSVNLQKLSHLLNENFKKEIGDVKGNFLIKSNNEVYSENFVVSQPVKDFVLKEVLGLIEAKKLNKSFNEDYFVFVHQGKIYFFKYNTIPEITFSCFENVKDQVMLEYFPSILREVTLKESDEIRYSYEDRVEVEKIKNWNKSDAVYDIKKYYEFLEKKVGSSKKGSKKEMDDESFYKLVSSKIENKNIKEGMSFILCNEDKCLVYGIKQIIREEDSATMYKKSFLDLQFLVDAYIEGLFKEAKIEFINNDVSL